MAALESGRQEVDRPALIRLEHIGASLATSATVALFLGSVPAAVMDLDDDPGLDTRPKLDEVSEEVDSLREINEALRRELYDYM